MSNSEQNKLIIQNHILTSALERIIKWHGEFPESGFTWDNGEPMSYGAAYGSNGERDYIRKVAKNAIDDSKKVH